MIEPIHFQEMVLYGRVKRKKEFSLVFERKVARLLKFDVPVFAAESGAWQQIMDLRRSRILHYQSFKLLISAITGNLHPGLTNLFVIIADLTELKPNFEEVNDYSGEKYYQLDFEVELVFDSTNLEGNALYNVSTLVPFLVSYPTDQCISKGDKYGPRTTFELH